MEEIVYDNSGRLRSNALSTYKIPDIHSVPKVIDILPLETTRENRDYELQSSRRTALNVRSGRLFCDSGSC